MALALGSAFFFVLGQILGKLALRDLNHTTFNLVRIAFVAAVLTPVVLAGGPQFGGTEGIIIALASGLVGVFAATQVFYYIMKRSLAHVIVTIANSTPAWTVVFALLLLGENLTVAIPVSVALVILGSFLLEPRKSGPSTWKKAVPLAILVAVLWGLDQVLRKWSVNYGTGALTFLWVAMVGATVLLGLNALAGRTWRGQRFTARNLGLTLASGASAQIVGIFLHLTALTMAGVSALAPITAAAIPFGFLMSVFIVRERPGKKAVAGMVLVFAGVFLATLY